MLSVAPLISPAAWLSLVAAAVAILTWYAFTGRGTLPRGRWAGIIAAMAAALVIPLVVLLNPNWVEPVAPPPGKPLITLLVDASVGMSTNDMPRGRSRFDAARETAAALAERMAATYDVEIRLFDEDVRGTTIEALAAARAEGEVTDLAGAIEETLVTDRPQGQTLVLLSDGIHNADLGAAHVIDAAVHAKAVSAPIYVRSFGGDAPVRDVELRFQTPQELSFIHQKLPVDVRVESHGLAGRKVEVELRRDGRTIDRKPTTLVEGVTEVTFLVGDHKLGLFRFEAVVQPLAGEVSEANNLAPLLLRVVDEPIRILLLEGKPYWDTKFLARTLTADGAVELTSVVQTVPGRMLERTFLVDLPDAEANPDDAEKKSGTTSQPKKDATAAVAPSLPTDPSTSGLQAAVHHEKWQVVRDPTVWLRDDAALDRFQVIVLGRDSDVFLGGGAPDRLRRWIDRSGGALVCFRGAPTVQTNPQLASLMPMRFVPSRETRFHVELTDSGRDLQWFTVGDGDEGDAVLGRLPTLASSSQPERLKPAARVLAAAVGELGSPGRPVVTYQPYGLGQVVVVEGAGMWRWAFLPPEHQRKDQVYSTLWRGLIRRLVSDSGLLPQQTMALRAERVLFNDREPAAAVLIVRNQTPAEGLPEIELTGTGLDGAPRRVRPVPVGDDPNVFRVNFGRLTEGHYRANIVGSEHADGGETAFDVRRNLRERIDLKARPDLLARVAAESGGAVLQTTDADRVAQQITAAREQARPREVRRTIAWDRWWVFAAVALMWGTSWTLRRRSGRI